MTSVVSTQLPLTGGSKRILPVSDVPLQNRIDELATPTWASGRAAVVVIAAAVLLTFGRLCRYEFISIDDIPFIALNPSYIDPSWMHVWECWRRPFYDIYIPVTATFWQLLAWAGRRDQPDPSGLLLDPFPFHAANVLVHLASSLIAFFLLRRLLKSQGAALAGALVFALHPVQVETVGWISGLKDLLAGVGSLAAIALYLKAGDEPGGGRRRLWLYVASTLALLLAMLSKPSAITTPAVMFVIDVVLQRRPWRQAAVWLFPWFVLALGIAALARHIQPVISGISERGYSAYTPVAQRPLIVGHTLAFYMGHVLWPAKLGTDYGHMPDIVLASHWSWFAWIVPVAALAVAASFWQRTRVPLAALAVFILAPFPMLGWVGFDFQLISTTADHYLYVAMFGFALLVGWACTRLPKAASVAVPAVLVLALGVRSFVQAGYWSDSQTLYQHVLTANPNSWVMHGSLAQLAMDRKDWPAAAEHCRQAIQLQPKFTPAYIALGTTLTHLRDYSGALTAYSEAVGQDPGNPLALMYLGGLQASLGDHAEAEKNLRAALMYDPNQPTALLNYGTVIHKRGDAASAEPYLRKSVQVSPIDVRGRMNLARCLIDLGRRDEAVEQLQIAYTLQPGNPVLTQALRDLNTQPSTTMPVARP